MPRDLIINNRFEELEMAHPNPRASIMVAPNKQVSKIGRKIYPPDRYPVAWYIGFSDIFYGLAQKITSAFNKVSVAEAKIANNYIHGLHQITMYFNNEKTMERIVSKILEDDILLVSIGNSVPTEETSEDELINISSNDILSNAKKIFQRLEA